jgi:hypothetical protein
MPSVPSNRVQRPNAASRVRSVLPAPTTAALVAVVFAVYALYLRHWGDPHFYYDAQQYWTLAGTFGSAGHFSLLDFTSDERGYALPLFNRLLQLIAGHVGMGAVTIVLLVGSLEAALLGVVLVPRLVRVLWPSARVTPARILLLNGLIFFFWRDYFGFPLSDFPALTLAIFAFLALSRRSLPGYVIAGLAAGLAWNVRPAYSVTLVLLLVLTAVRGDVRRTPARAAGGLALVLVGIVVVILPQSLINHRHEHSWSPAVPNVLPLQLSLGMQYQRRESYVGPPTRSPAVFYADPSTQRLLDDDGLTAVSGIGQYAQIVERHPVVMVAGWARRIFDGFDVRYSTVYIPNLNSATWRFSLFDYVLLFIAFAQMLVPAFRRRIGRVSWPEIAALACGCITSIPFAMETRFFLPGYLIIYSVVAFGSAPRPAWASLGRGERVTLGILFPVFLLLCVTLSSSAIANVVP